MAILLWFKGIRPTIHPTAWMAPTATIIGNVPVEEDSFDWIARGAEHYIELGRR